MDISIIIPAYNEQNKISADIFAADTFIVKNKYEGEIIIVDDGSSDNTFEAANLLKEKIQSILKIIKLENNIGKGGAVRKGVLSSLGKIVMYADAGLTVPFENALVGIKLIEEDKCDIANGSRKTIGAKILKEQDLDRKLISGLFLIFIKLFLKIPKELTDTQCGFKIYKGDIARELFGELKLTGFLFEIELILLAIKRNYKILEFPVTWKCDRDSRLSVGKSSKSIIKEFITLIKKY